MLALVEGRILNKGVNQLVKDLTWLSGNGKSRSLIDHIYTDSDKYSDVTSTRNTGSDHDMVGVIRKGDSKILRTQFRRARNMANFSRDDFMFALNNLDLDPILFQPKNVLDPKFFRPNFYWTKH